MKLFTNGFPKCGNHALQKACELLGQPAEVNHIPFSEGLPEGTTHSIFIKRDPRDVIISAIRFSGQEVTSGMFLTWFRQFKLEGELSLVDAMARYEGWLTEPNTLVVSLERLRTTDETMREMANYLGIPYIDGAFEHLPGLTRTCNETPSDHRPFWTPEVISVWEAEGGNELLTRWGY